MSEPDNNWEFTELPDAFIASDAAYGDGLFVVVGVSVVSGTYWMTVWTAAAAEGPWTRNAIANVADNPYHIRFGDGVWAIVSFDAGVVWTTDDPAGEWAEGTGFDSEGHFTEDMGFRDGEWAVLLTDGRLLSTDDPSTAWTLAHDFDLDDNNYERAAMSPYESGWLVALMDGYDYIRLFSASTADGTWTERASWDNDGDIPPVNVGKTPEGYFVALADGGYDGLDLWSSETLGGTWSRVKVVSGVGNYNLNISYLDGIYGVSGTQLLGGGYGSREARFATSTTLAGTYVREDVSPGVLYNEDRRVFGIYAFEGGWLAIGQWDAQGPTYPVVFYPVGTGAGWGLVL